MKTLPRLLLGSLVISSSLMAAPRITIEVAGLDEAKIDKLLEQRAALTYTFGDGLEALTEMEPRDETIQSILQNKESKTEAPNIHAPIVIHSMQSAAEHLNRASMEKLDVDFDKQQVVIFAWKGSNKDTLMGYMRDGEGLVADFIYMQGDPLPQKHSDDLSSRAIEPEELHIQTAVFVMTKDTKTSAREVQTRRGKADADK